MPVQSGIYVPQSFINTLDPGLRRDDEGVVVSVVMSVQSGIYVPQSFIKTLDPGLLRDDEGVVVSFVVPVQGRYPYS
ncbi:hypothetical protein AWR36_000095 [Microbulbifer flavimaris]|uniref:Uncharacterized protein n=1 Tax=Microbulbifer flavimaris TaxID=1781068 RepID=A0ABX4I296_9GAMM|nr:MULTISPECIES: hypothetical protein [Microbulbifer]KUJ84158.1 hypothetical protein AVO43_00095 [Microbulbifer sp. ZGT114]PCO06231.1 hypothetical protein AWR36_000095 [Microbulbifer flavimaris]